MTIINVIHKSDWIGIFTSGLCVLHCMATPFLFVAHAGIGIQGQALPPWWGFVDFAFLLLSFLAVYWSAKKTSKKWVAQFFWVLWGVLALIIANEKWGFWQLTEAAIYFPTIGLVLLHFYNHRYCRRKEANCSAGH